MSAPSPVTLRLAQPDDRDILEELLSRVDNFDEEEQRVALELIDICLGDGPTAGPEGDYPTLVAELDGTICGYATIGRTPFTESTWHLYFIAADPQRRRAGIGRALCQACAEFVGTRGGQRIVLETAGREDYGGTRGFYLATGFREEGRIADYYRPGDDVVYYVWRW